MLWGVTEKMRERNIWGANRGVACKGGRRTSKEVGAADMVTSFFLSISTAKHPVEPYSCTFFIMSLNLERKIAEDKRKEEKAEQERLKPTKVSPATAEADAFCLDICP